MAHVTSQDPLWQVKLLAALRSGDIAQIQPFLNDIKPNKKQNSSEHETIDETAGVLLHFAIRGASYETIELVLSNKYISPNLASPPGSSFTAIHLASSLGRIDVLKLLIEQDGADDTLIDDQGQSALDIAKDQRTLHVLRESQDDFRRQYTVLLAQYIASPNQASPVPASGELLAILKSPRVKLLDLSLLDATSGTTLLHEAARRRDQPLVEAAVHAGADVFVRDRRGKEVLDGDKDKDGDRIRAFLRQYLNQDTSLVGSLSNDPPLYKGYLSKYANVAKGYNTRWFVLKDDMLSYYRNRDDEGLAIRGAVSVRTARIKTIPGDKLRFEVHAHAPSTQGSQSTLAAAGQKWYMKANHPGEVARWTQVLTRSIEFYQQKDRTQHHPLGSDGESIKSNREGSKRAKSLRSSVDMLRGWSGRSTHSANRSTTDVGQSTGKAESSISHGAPEVNTNHEEDDSASHSSSGSDTSHVPHADRFHLQLQTMQMEIGLVKRLLDELSLPPNSPPRVLEVKSTLQRSALTLQDSVDQYTTMARERETWYASRVQQEADARRMWEENVVTLANQSEQVERELVRSMHINKGQRRVLKNLLGSGLQEDPETPRATIDIVPTNEETLQPEVSAISSSALDRPGAPNQIDMPGTMQSPLRSPLAEQLHSLGANEILGDDESDTDEFFDAIESGAISNVPSAIRPQPNTPLPLSLDAEHYQGYRSLRDRLPIGSDNRPPVSLWAVLKGSIGKDLTKISFPVFFNEPTSMLQRMAEDMEYSECLDAAAHEQDPHKRIAYVAAFAMSNYSSTIGRIAKPFNPMLAETFEYCRLDKQYRYVSEQVSHHPPMSACWAESPQWNYYGEVDAKNKFMGKSFEIRPTGVAHADVKLPAAWAPHYPPAQGEPECGQSKVVEHYSWKKVTTNVSGFIVGQPTIDHYGDMTVVNHRTGDTCILTFKPRGWRAKDSFEIKGTVQDASGKVTWEIAGRWNSQLLARPAGSGAGDLLPDVDVASNQNAASQYLLLWKNTEKPSAPFNLTPFAVTLNDCPSDTLSPYLPPTDCRIRPDQRAFEMGRYERANELKSLQEDFQRATRRKRETGEMPSHKPRWFSEAIDEDTGERVWAPVRREERIEYWAERERVYKLGGKDQARWEGVDEIFITEE